MIYGIFATTDMKCPQSKIEKFTSLRSAQRWAANGSGVLAFPGSVGPEVPSRLQNHHHRLKELYEMPKGWSFRCKEVKKWMAECDRRHWHSSYAADSKAKAIRKWGEHL